jgi:hypothetical protein
MAPRPNLDDEGGRGTVTDTLTETTTTIPGGRPRRRLPWPVVLPLGLLAGWAWGINARVWMRFISTDPSFTWSGTLFIVNGFGIAALAQAGAYLGRRAELRRPWLTGVRVLTFIGLLPLGMAAGAMAFPTVVFAPLAIEHREWPRWWRGLIGLLALLPLGLVGWLLLDDLSVGRAAVGFVWFLALYAVIVWGAHFTLAPQRDGWRAPRAVRIAGAAALAAAVLLLAVAISGLPG